MVALKASDVDAFVARPDPARPIVLVFGPDAGLVAERAEAIVRGAVEDMRDPFALARIDGEELAAHPSRLVEEAHTIPLFGGRRAVWVKAGSRNIAPAVEALIAAPPGADCCVVIEAGDLKRNAPVRAMCEKAKAAAALPCYEDNERSLARMIDDELKSAGLSIDADARAALVSLLGGDRLASRSEVHKLSLYARGQERVGMDDILAVVADASALALNAVIDAAFAGRAGEMETQFAKARSAGTSADAIVGAALRQVAQLHRARLDIESGTDVNEAYARMHVHFSRERPVKQALSGWSASRLERLLGQLAGARLDTRRRPELAETIAHRALVSIADSARRRE
jgi:DNA polymerase III subunit delta